MICSFASTSSTSPNNQERNQAQQLGQRKFLQDRLNEASFKLQIYARTARQEQGLGPDDPVTLDILTKKPPTSPTPTPSSPFASSFPGTTTAQPERHIDWNQQGFSSNVGPIVYAPLKDEERAAIVAAITRARRAQVNTP